MVKELFAAHLLAVTRLRRPSGYPAAIRNPVTVMPPT
jgi:hypothetical protein